MRRFIRVLIAAYTPLSRRWMSIEGNLHWADNRRATLEAPMVGAFDQDIGTFYGDDVHEGHLVRARFIWDCRDAERPRWEQAFSTDEGQSRETNWVMTFERSSDNEVTA